VRKRITCPREAHRIVGDQGQAEALGKRDQAAIDELLTWLTVVSQLDVHMRLQLIESACKQLGLDGIGWILGPFDQRREHGNEGPACQAQLASVVLLQVLPVDPWPAEIGVGQVRLVRQRHHCVEYERPWLPTVHFTFMSEGPLRHS
jgi:hypothetical protein